jgi:hypothetical protein
MRMQLVHLGRRRPRGVDAAAHMVLTLADAAMSSAKLRGGVGPEIVQSELSNSICPVTEPKQWPSRSKIMFRMTQASVQKALCGGGCRHERAKERQDDPDS